MLQSGQKMSVSSRYIGHTHTYTCPITNENIELIEGQSYLIDIRVDGPRVVINGQPIIMSDSTYWLIFDNGRIQIPYSPEALPKQWQGLEA